MNHVKPSLTLEGGGKAQEKCTPFGLFHPGDRKWTVSSLLEGESLEGGGEPLGLAKVSAGQVALGAKGTILVLTRKGKRGGGVSQSCWPE